MKVSPHPGGRFRGGFAAAPTAPPTPPRMGGLLPSYAGNLSHPPMQGGQGGSVRRPEHKTDSAPPPPPRSAAPPGVGRLFGGGGFAA